MPYRSIRQDATQPVAEPNSSTISHETNKKGLRSSVHYLEDIKVVSDTTSNIVKTSPVRTMFKIQFEPFGGRTDQAAVIQQQINEHIAFLSDPANISKFLNQEA